jgi:hypothetical protein
MKLISIDSPIAVFAAALAIDAARSIAASDDLTAPPAASSDGQAQKNRAAKEISNDEKQRRLRLRQIAEGYKANRAAFTFGKCRISHENLSADTVEDALADRLNKPQKRKPFEMTFCFRDDALVFRTLPNEQNFARKGRFALYQNGNTAVVHPPHSPFKLEDGFHPLDMLVSIGSESPSPVSVVSSAEARNYEGVELTREDGVIRDGKEFLLLKRRSAADDLDADFYIDRSRGYLPVMSEYFRKGSAEPHVSLFLLDIRRQGPGWFPMRSMLIEPRKTREGKPYVLVRDKRVLALELGKPPDDADLVIQFSKGAQFRNQGDPDSTNTLFANAAGDVVSVSVSQIEEIYQQLQEVAQENKRSGAAGAAIYAFGWLFGDARGGNINIGQILGRTESGQLLYLAANQGVQQDLGLEPEQIGRVRNLVAEFGKDLFDQLRPQDLSRTAIEELYSASREERGLRLREINEEMPDLEQELCKEHFAALGEILTGAQLARLQGIRWKLAGSRALADDSLVKALELTAEQQTAIMAVNAEHDERLIEYFSTDFSGERTGDVPIFQELMTRVQKMSGQRNKDAEAVLNQRQREKLFRLRGKPLK